MLKGADALAGIRFEHDSGEASLIAALSALEAIGAGEQRDTIISASGALSLFRETEGLEWVDTKEKSRHLLRRLGFRSATYRRERFWGREQPDRVKDTAKGYEIEPHTLRALLARYATNVDPSRTSHPHGQNDSGSFPSLKIAACDA